MALFTVKIGGQNMSPMQALKAGSKFSPQGKLAEGVFKTFKKAALGTGAIFGATMLYFAQLGAAALKGAIIGATIGGTAGAVVGGVMGFNIGLAVGTALAPFTFGLSVPVFTALGTATGIATGGFLGATIGAIAGGLIALGIASGSSTLFSMGVGAGIGGAIGGVVGFSVGTTIAATLDTLAIAACVATLIGCALIPVVAVANPVIIAVSTAVGAVAGAAVGAYTGYLIGHYVIPAFTNTYITVKGFFGGAAGASGAGAGAVGGFFAAAGSFLTGAASFFWNNVVVGGAKAAWGFVSGLVEKGIGVLSSAAGGGASIAAPAVTGAVGTVVVGSTIVGIVTSTAFFNPEVDNVLARVGDTPYMTVSKIASPNRIRNDDLPKEITFFITIKAKYVRLDNIDIEDKLEVESNTGTFEVTTDINGNSITEPCQGNQPTYLLPGDQWNCQFTIRATNDSSQTFADSLITNIITFVATPEGQEPIGTVGTALVIIGGPAASPPPPTRPRPNVPPGTGEGCPSGWPLATGYITQGPLGSTSHAGLYSNNGEEAIDIAGNDIGIPTYATFSGTVILAGNNGGYGKDVDIFGTCNGVDFTARWAHLNTINSAIVLGANVSRGDLIGGIDATGHVEPAGAAGTHLHYSFFGLPISTPFIPQNPASPNCDSVSSCDVSW